MKQLIEYLYQRLKANLLMKHKCTENRHAMDLRNEVLASTVLYHFSTSVTAASSDSETVGSAFVRLKLDLEETKV